MRTALWCWLVLSACLLATRADAQILHVVSARAEIYGYVALACLPPVEMDKVSSEHFTAFADTVFPYIFGCEPYADSYTWVEQQTTILSDSIDIHQRSAVDMLGTEASRAARAKGDTWIRFTVDPGRRLAYHLWGTLWTQNPYSGTAIARYSLTHAGGAEVHSAYFEVTGGPPTELGGGLDERGFLDAGDYIFEAHTSADADYHPAYTPPETRAGRANGEIWLVLGLRDITTAIAPSSWGLVKTLYR
jgi:hypothetical protein